MKISKGNIEEYIFDYYEGNLSTVDSNQLLDYIHQNPHFESLFSSWAMTYAHKEAQPKKYNLEAILLKKSSFQWVKYIMVSALFLIPSIVYYNTEFSKERTKENFETKNQVEVSDHEKVKTETIFEQKKEELVLTKAIQPKKQIETSFLEKNPTSDVLTEEIKIDTIKKFLVPVVYLEEMDTNSQAISALDNADSLKSQTILADTIQYSEPKHREKRVRKGFKIEPAKEVKPINSDF